MSVRTLLLQWIKQALATGALMLLMTSRAPAQTSGNVFYSAFETATGLLTTHLRSISPAGTGDEPITLPLLNPAYAAFTRDFHTLAVAAGDPARPSKLSADVYLVRPFEGQIQKLSAFEDTAGASGFATFYPSYLAISPDGKRVAAGMVSYLGARSTVIYTNQFGDPYGPYDTRSKISRCVSLMVFSTNGAAPYFVASPLCDDDFAHPGEGVDWSPTQDLIAYPYNTTVAFGGAGGFLALTAIHLMETTPNAADQGRRRQITFPTGTTGFPFDPISLTWSGDFAPAFSPDGQQVAYVRSTTEAPAGALSPSPALTSIRVVNTDATGDREVIAFQRGNYITRIAWSPDGKQLVFDLGAQALRSGFPLRTWDPETVTLAKVNLDGTGFAQIRGPRAAWPAWLPAAAQSETPRVSLTLSRSDSSITFSWTDPAGGFVFETSSSLGPQAEWTPVAVTATANGTAKSLTLPVTGDRAYFRLRKP